MNAFVLAGGASSRMGRDKALLPLNGRPLIEHALDKLLALGFTPRIVGSRPDLASFAPVVPDNFPGSGPLGGIEAALAASNTQQNLFLAVDLPLLPVSFLRWLIDRAALTNALATIPLLQWRPQPLCAVYSRALLPHIRSALAARRAKVMLAIESAACAMGAPIDTCNVESIATAQSWPQPFPLHSWFQNINTPSDLETLTLEHFAGIE
ncbi:MAG TPA: molybdenum cofactor guanylyltransferase [Acidobacteriaceae bacterium]|nr:molybdenum cofactor guanylyltransferase [Acidobacteriaceae bacterium]